MLFYAVYLYSNACKYLKMGYASAMAWLLFFIVLGVTYVNALVVALDALRGDGGGRERVGALLCTPTEGGCAPTEGRLGCVVEVALSRLVSGRLGADGIATLIVPFDESAPPYVKKTSTRSRRSRSGWAAASLYLSRSS